MNVDPDTVRLFSHHLMAVGFIAALTATLSIKRYGYAIIFLIALIETYTEFRYPFHVKVRDFLLGSAQLGPAKTLFQTKLLVGAAVAGILVCLAMLPFLARMATGGRLMATGVLMIVAMLGVELISLHAVDAILYHPIGPFARCSVVYFIGAILAAGGALVERRRQAGLRRGSAASLQA